MNATDSAAPYSLSSLPFDVIDQIAIRLHAPGNAAPCADFQALALTCKSTRAWAKHFEAKVPAVDIPSNRVDDLRAATRAIVADAEGPARLLREPRLHALFTRVRRQQALATQSRAEKLSVVCRDILVELESASVGQLKHVLGQLHLANGPEQAKLALTHVLRLARELAPDARTGLLKDVSAALTALPRDWQGDLGAELARDCDEWPPVPSANLLLHLDWTARGLLAFDSKAIQSMLAAIPARQWQTLLPQMESALLKIPGLIDCVLQAPAAPQADIVSILSGRAVRAMEDNEHGTLLNIMCSPTGLALCDEGKKLQSTLRKWFRKWFTGQQLSRKLANAVTPVLRMQVDTCAREGKKEWREHFLCLLGVCKNRLGKPELAIPGLLDFAETVDRIYADNSILPWTVKIGGGHYWTFTAPQMRLAAQRLHEVRNARGRKALWKHMFGFGLALTDLPQRRQLVIELAAAACRWDEPDRSRARARMLGFLRGDLRKEVKLMFKQAG